MSDFIGKVRLTGENTGLTLRCDAIAVQSCQGEDAVLLLSACGSETSVKALTAVMRSKARVEIEAHFDDGDTRHFNAYRLRRHEAGYIVRRARIGPGTWHVLLTAKAEGFMPVLTDEALWQELRSERFTTPILRAWVPWLRKEMVRCNRLAKVRQYGCECGLMVAVDKWLDGAVSSGVKKGKLEIKR